MAIERISRKKRHNRNRNIPIYQDQEIYKVCPKSLLKFSLSWLTPVNIFIAFFFFTPFQLSFHTLRIILVTKIALTFIATKLYLDAVGKTDWSLSKHNLGDIVISNITIYLSKCRAFFPEKAKSAYILEQHLYMFLYLISNIGDWLLDCADKI